MYNKFVFYVREDNIKYKMGEELMNILLKHITRNMKENVGRTTLIMLSLFVVSILVAIITLGILFIIMMSMFTDDTLETQVGATLFTFFNSFLIFCHEPSSESISKDC